jgi:RimJ/RimL family protein N-acetyltransferase
MTRQSAVLPSVEPPAPWMQTMRIDLREFTANDAEDLYRLHSDPRVMRYIANGRPDTREDIARILERVPKVYRAYHGLGTWRASRRDTGDFIGWFTFKYVPDTCEIEVGYRLLHEAWGQGFATEGATELVRYGFDDLGLMRIIGLTHPGNRASQRVLMKAGLADRGWGHYYGRRLRLFVADRA